MTVWFEGVAGEWLGRSVSVLSLALMVGCSGQTATLAPQDPLRACRPVTGTVPPAVSLTVALLEPVDPTRAPVPGNASEELLFAHFYEPLFSVDCLGRVRPQLAASWETTDDGESWVIRLNEGARFWDAAPVTSTDVVMSWHAAPSAAAVIDSVVAIGPRTVRAYLRQPSANLPHELAAPVFSVTRPSMISGWPMGTGPYQPVPPYGSSSGRMKYAAQPTGHSKSGAQIDFMVSTMEDARDVIADGVDLMITADPKVIEYASRSPLLEPVPLPWHVTYALLSVSRAQEVLLTSESRAQPLTTVRSGLATDVLRVDAREFQPPLWWNDADRCEDTTGRDGRSPTASNPEQVLHVARTAARKILFRQTDPVARDIAERIVSIASMEPSSSSEATEIASAVPGIAGPVELVTEGVSDDMFESALQQGTAFLYVMRTAKRVPDPCAAATDLLEKVPWLVPLEGNFAEAFVPLVDTRRHAIIAKNRIGLIVDWYGNVRIETGVSQGR